MPVFVTVNASSVASARFVKPPLPIDNVSFGVPNVAGVPERSDKECVQFTASTVKFCAPGPSASTRSPPGSVSVPVTCTSPSSNDNGPPESVRSVLMVVDNALIVT